MTPGHAASIVGTSCLLGSLSGDAAAQFGLESYSL
jgi:hypothetical protein